MAQRGLRRFEVTSRVLVVFARSYNRMAVPMSVETHCLGTISSSGELSAVAASSV